MIALRRLLWACCLGLATGGVLAQTTAAPAFDRARLDAFMQALSRHDQALGSVAIALPGQPLYTRATGQASADATPLATPETRYRIGSISKLFTATLVMQQVQARRLSLDTRLSRFYPQLPNAERITIEQLLRHRSGLGDLKDAPDFEQRLARAPQDEATLLAVIREAGTQFEPDTRSHYNNSGPILLGFILQRITGQRYGALLREHIAEPLGLSNTFYSDTPDHGPQASQSLHWQGAWAATPATHPTVPQGSGAVVSTPSDLVRFIQALFAQRLVNADSLAQMSRLVDGFGLGLVRLPPADAPGLGRLQGYGHEGVIDAYSAVLMILPQQGVALAWCSNGARLPREAVVTALLRTVFEPGYRAPTFEPVTTTIDFALTLPQTPSTGAAPAIVNPGLRGSVPPLSWDTTTPLRLDPVDGRWKTRLTFTLPEGTALEYKYVHGQLTWERTPNRALWPEADRPQQVTDRWEEDAMRQRLRAEVMAADQRLFGAFNHQDADTMAQIFSPRLEFFHDKDGLSDHAQTMRQLRSNFARGVQPRRELVEGSVEVWPAGDFGAMQTGAHRFCPGQGSAAGCQTFRFAHVWARTPQGLQLLRVLSFDH